MREQGAVLGRGVGEKIEFFGQARRRLIFQGAVYKYCPEGKIAANEACAEKASFTNVPRPKQTQSIQRFPYFSPLASFGTSRKIVAESMEMAPMQI